MKFNLNEKYNDYVLIRGAGDLASGVGKSLFDAGFKVIMTEINEPSFIRGAVSFGSAIYEKEVMIEGIRAKISEIKLEQFDKCHKEKIIPIIVDPFLKSLEYIKPFILVDATIAKRNLGTNKDMADIVIAVGPGFKVNVDAHAIIESNRGHNLGRTFYEGEVEKNTGVPGDIKGYSAERVIHTEYEGKIQNIKKIGDIVKKDECIAIINNNEVLATIDGVLRGLIRDGFYCTKGLKIADIDPRITEVKNCFTISDKSRAIGNAVLFTILNILNKRQENN